MTIVFWGKGKRGVECLKVVHQVGYIIPLVVVHPDDDTSVSSVGNYAKQLGISVLAPEDPNTIEFQETLKYYAADVFALCGYGKILQEKTIKIPRQMCINLHGGKLPEVRGSSPMNWALIFGHPSFTISIIQVEPGVDTGPVLAERTFPIVPNDTIADLHTAADAQFPSLLQEVLQRIADGAAQPRPQDPARAAYYPLRFSEDGFILWDMLTAEQIHNRIRALTEPYPCAFTFFQGRKVRLLCSELTKTPYYGEPGRIYQKSGRGILVAASDQCLLITKASFEDGTNALDAVARYDKFATVREAVMKIFSTK